MLEDKNKRKAVQHVIRCVEPGSIADELELEPGDILVSIGGNPVEDIFDYRFMINEEYLTLVVRKPSGEEWELEIEKEYEDDLGIEFENGLMDDYRSCSNKCIFCFIDQNPKNMRDTLYFKDDDSRLSFIQGNYVTLTNMSDHDIDRIINYHMGPINISFHTLNPELRCRMLHNRFAGDIFPKVKRLAEAGIEMNGQIVLCKGWNDGEELERSLRQFEEYMPALQSVSVVPIGMTRFRDGLEQIEPFTAEDAGKVLDQIHRWQEYYMKQYGTHLVHAGDEWYILAGREFPDEAEYDGYQQLENGVGMITLLRDEVRQYLGEIEGDDRKAHVSIATGMIAYPYIKELADKVTGQFPGIRCDVYPIRNDFYGGRITVAGLLTGTDLKNQLAGKDLGDRLLLTTSMLRSGERVFLDDVTVEELETALQTPIRIVESDGQSFTDAIIKEDTI